jgi:hypothetical protein
MSRSTGLWRASEAAARGPIKHNLVQLTDARGWDSRPGSRQRDTIRVSAALPGVPIILRRLIKIWVLNHENKKAYNATNILRNTP